MTTTDYLIDSALVLMVLLMVKERQMTTRFLIRPLIILGVAVASYFQNIPTGGNDLELIALIGLVGAAIGVASGFTAIMRRREDGVVTTRTGWSSALLWILGMGSRFAFAVWISHGGVASVASFSAAHSITTSAAWTDALLAMAIGQVVGRVAVQAVRWRRLDPTALPGIALS